MKRIIFLLSCIATSLACANESLPKGVKKVQTLDDISEYKLESNGLRILLMPTESLPVATVMVTYEVGSRNEVTGTTGATHILEHMMFKGTDKFNSAQNNDYSSQMERIGARTNATTSFDRTNYFAVLPSQYVPLAIELEADRMRNLRIREEDLASEMTVVRNEYERGENNPVRTLIKEMYSTAFVAQPYGHPVIGWRSDIENTSPEKLHQFYDTYYWPENAVVSVIGGFDPKEILQVIANQYGAISNAPKPIPTVDTEEPEQLGPRRFTIERNGQVGVVMIGYKVPEGTHEDWPELALIEQILGADKTGRLYRALEDKGIASATFSYAPQLRDPSLFMLAAYLTPNATHEESESIILDEVQKLINEGVSQDELARAKSVLRASLIYGRDGPYAIASQINESIAMGDWTSYVNLPNAIKAVTAEELQAVAKKYFVHRNSSTGWFVPQKAEPVAQISRTTAEQYYRDPELFAPLQNQASEPAASTPAAKVNFASHIQQAKVGDIEVIAIEMPIDEVVSFVGSFAAGETLSPEDAPTLAALTASMIDKGTTQQDRFAIAEKLEKLGADLAFSASSHSLSFGGKFLKADAAPVMQLLAEQLRSPAFDPEVFATLKQRQLAGLMQAIDDPDYRAESALARKLYPKGHPNYASEIETLVDDLKETTIDDVRSFHQDFYGPKSMRLVFAGDIDFPQLVASVEIAFEDWNGGVDYPSSVPEALSNQATTEQIVIADKTSVSVRFGYNTGLQRTDPEYLPFMVGNYLLGGSFNSRLMSEVRKNQGLTYSIHSGHEGDILTAGNWNLGASFAPPLLDQGIAATNLVVNEWFQNGVSEGEVSAAIDTLSGSYLVGLATTERVAGQVLSFMQRGFPADYIDTYPEVLSQVTAEQVNQSIQAHLNPEKLTQVIAGSIAIDTSAASLRSIRIQVDTPDSGWRLKIKQIYQTADGIAVYSELSHDASPAAQVISTVSDQVTLKVPEGLPIKHYITGKTWNWGTDLPNQSFIDDFANLSQLYSEDQLIYRAD